MRQTPRGLRFLLLLPLLLNAECRLAGANDGDRVSHFALLSTGPSLNDFLEPLYWNVNESMYRVLRNYGYPHEAIYRLSENGRADSRRVDGQSTVGNFRAACKHIAELSQPDDHVYIFLVGHGRPANGGFVTRFIDGELSSKELGELVGTIASRNITLIIHPCHSGGFIPAVSGPGRVVVTSTNENELNAVPWAEAFIEALTPEGKNDLNGDGRVSICEAYTASLRPGRERYGTDLQEHPLLDDNGDSVGHFGELPRNGDGLVAKKRFLGNDGSPLHFDESALHRLRQLNSKLQLQDARHERSN